jgi:prevent-host-death family protein
MRLVPLTEAKARFSEVIERLDEPVVITRHGYPVAVLMAVPDDQEDVDSLLIAHDPGFRAMIRRAKQSRLLTSDDFWEKYDAGRPRRSSRKSRR